MKTHCKECGTIYGEVCNCIQPADANCKLIVKDRKLWCTECESFHEVSKKVNCWKDHTIVKLSMKHVLYVAYYCETCNDGKVLIDEEV